MKTDYSRRRALAIVGTGFLSGCMELSRDYDSNQNGRVYVGADTYRRNESWYATISVHHVTENIHKLHNVTVVGYSKEGETVCRAEFGNSTGPPSAALDDSNTVECDGFPYIIAVKADESPCTGVEFDIIRWIGTAKHKRERSSGVGAEKTWESFRRKCNESLPPERLLPDDLETTTEESPKS